jgi:hypothetical protein
MGPIDYKGMVQGLLGVIQPVGDVIPFRRRPQRGEVPGIPETGPMGGGGSGGIPMPLRVPEQRKYDNALAHQKGEPMTLQGGPWTIRSDPMPKSHQDMLKSIEKIKDDKWRKYLEDKIKRGEPLFSWEAPK